MCTNVYKTQEGMFIFLIMLVLFWNHVSLHVPLKYLQFTQLQLSRAVKHS